MCKVLGLPCCWLGCRQDPEVILSTFSQGCFALLWLFWYLSTSRWQFFPKRNVLKAGAELELPGDRSEEVWGRLNCVLGKTCHHSSVQLLLHLGITKYYQESNWNWRYEVIQHFTCSSSLKSPWEAALSLSDISCARVGRLHDNKISLIRGSNSSISSGMAPSSLSLMSRWIGLVGGSSSHIPLSSSIWFRFCSWWITVVLGAIL